MSTLNEHASRFEPTICDFWWNAKGPLLKYTIGETTFPYTTQEDKIVRASDARYEAHTSPIQTAIKFDATGKASSEHPKVLTPPNVHIIEYLWDFGDGSIGYGPEPSHTYELAIQSLMVTLTVTDSRRMTASCSKPLNLYYASKAWVVAYKVRV